MKAILQLYIKGSFFNEQEIEIPDYDRSLFEDYPELMFKTNECIRELYVFNEMRMMEALYSKQIVKMEYKYHFVLVAESRLNQFSMEEIDLMDYTNPQY